VIAIHAVLLPKTDGQLLLWQRLRWETKWPAAFPYNTIYRPDMIGPDGNPEAAVVYDTNNGTYTVKPHRIAPFCR
jgi:hypothetical protein